MLGDSTAVTWVDAQGKLKPENFDYDFVEGGHESNGTPISIALVEHDDVILPGKARRDMDGKCEVNEQLAFKN